MIGVSAAAASAYQHRAERLRAELADARANLRRGTGTQADVERLEVALQQLQADARQNGVRL